MEETWSLTFKGEGAGTPLPVRVRRLLKVSLRWLRSAVHQHQHGANTAERATGCVTSPRCAAGIPDYYKVNGGCADCHVPPFPPPRIRFRRHPTSTSTPARTQRKSSSGRR